MRHEDQAGVYFGKVATSNQPLNFYTRPRPMGQSTISICTLGKGQGFYLKVEKKEDENGN